MYCAVLPVLLAVAQVFASGHVRSACEYDYPPFSLVEESGEASGFSVELLTAALSSMDYSVSYITGPWAEVKDSLAYGSVTCLPLVGRTPEREELFDFTFPYMTLYGSVVVPAGCDSVHSMEDLAGCSVGVMAADNAEEFLYREGYDSSFTIVSVPTYEDALLLLNAGEVDAVVVQKLVAQGLIETLGLYSSLRICSWPVEDFRQDFCFAVKDGDSEFLAVLNEGLAGVMRDGTYSMLHAKWFARMEIHESRRIIAGADSNYPPFEFVDSLGNPAGINVDVMRYTAAEAGLDVEIRTGEWAEIREAFDAGEIDVLCGLSYSPARERTADFTPHHTAVNYVAAVSSGRPPESLEEIHDLRVAVENGDLSHDYLIEEGFSEELLLFPSEEEALYSLLVDSADCAIVSSITAVHFIEENDWDIELGVVPFTRAEFSIAVRKGDAALLVLLNQGLMIIKETGVYRRLYEKWLGEYPVPAVPLSFLDILGRSLVVLVPLLGVILLGTVWLRVLRRQVRHRTRELQRSRDLLDATQRLAHVGGWQYILNTRHMHWTAETYAIYGIDPSDGSVSSLDLLKTGSSCFSPEDRVRVSSAFDRCVEKGEAYRIECSFTSLDGVRKWVLTGAEALWENGSISGVSGFIRDITEAREAEKEKRYRDRLLRDMEGIANVGAWEYDTASEEFSCTDQVSRIFDSSVDAGASPVIFLQVFRGIYRKRIDKALKLASSCRQAFDMELSLVTPGGETRWVRMIGRPVVTADSVKTIQGTIQDITGMKQQEQRIAHLNLVLRAIRDINQLIVREFNRSSLLEMAAGILVKHRSYRYALILTVDPNGKPVIWKHAGLEDVEHEIEEYFSSGNLPECYSHIKPGCNTVSRDRCGNCPLYTGGSESVELCAPLENAGERYGYLSVSLYRGVEVNEEEEALLTEMAEDLGYALSVMGEREARVRAEADREEMQRQLLQSQKMEAVGQLAGGVAHDFNNMLQVILGHARFLEESCGREDCLPSITGILEGGRRAAELTRQLLLFSRRQVMTLRNLDFNQVIENMLKMIRRLIGEHIRLEWIPGKATGSIRADAGMMEQILMNLCLNARDAMPQGGVLTIETMNVVIDSSYCNTHSWASPGRFVLLTVTDTGIGMDRETLDRIFEPFFTTKREGKGTGIGLATVYGIVKQHEGMINAYSEPGRGSVFKVYLPMGEARADEVGVTLQGMATGGSETILLAEDDPLVRELAVQMLSRAGYTVMAAEDGEEAVAMFGSNSDIDLLLLDVIMPKMGGYDAYERIREIDAHIPVLFSSGYSRNAIHTDFVLHDGLSLIQKPYSSDELLRAVRKALEN